MTRRGPTLLCAALLAAALLPVSAGAEEKEKKSRQRLSGSGAYSIQMIQGPGADACRIEVRKEGEPHWTLEKCLGTADDLFFISDDGERFWVLYTVPEKGRARPAQSTRKGGKRTRARAARYPAWTYSVVAALYDREGTTLKRKWLNEFINSGRGLGQVQALTRHFKWLAGVAGVTGRPPTLDEQGRVALETVEQRTFKLEFKE